MTTPGMRLGPQDEYPHPLEDARNFNESVYWNCFDPAQGMGGWMRLGNRANEGYAELSVCLYLPGGRLGFMYRRPEIAGNDRFEAGGMFYDVLEPPRDGRGGRISAGYRGPLIVMKDPSELRDPSAVFRNNPRIDCEAEWELRGISPLHGGEPTSDDVQTLYGRDFSRGHFNQHIASGGLLRIGDERFDLDGLGWRDHSWGPRYWQNIGYHRLLVANFGQKDGFMFLKITDLDGTTRRHGVLMREGEYEEIRDLDLITEWSDDPYQRAVDVYVRTDRGGERIRGEVQCLAPLRNRREEGGRELRTQITEAMTRWTWGDRTGLGFSEYLDLVRDGKTMGYPG